MRWLLTSLGEQVSKTLTGLKQFWLRIAEPSIKRYRKIEKKAAKRARTNSPECRDSGKDGFRCTGCSAKLDHDFRAKGGREVEAGNLLRRRSPPTGEIIPPVAESPQTHGSRINESSRYYQPSRMPETLRPVPMHLNSPQTLPSISLSTMNSTQLPSTAVIPPSKASYEIRQAHIIEVRLSWDPFLPNVHIIQKPNVAAALPALQERLLPPPHLQASRVESISFYNMGTLPRIRGIDESEREGIAEQKVDARNRYSSTAYNSLAGIYDSEPRILGRVW